MAKSLKHGSVITGNELLKKKILMTYGNVVSRTGWDMDYGIAV